jgi:hypothetical protein
VAEAWRFRERVEREAAQRFARLADAIARFDPDSPVPVLMMRAADDERRHASLCARLAESYGAAVPDAPVSSEIAPRRLGPREAALYEVVAACCITETESVATVTTLLAEDAEPDVREALHEIARDEVLHSRMGWTHLARESGRGDVSFLGAFLPAMLAGTLTDQFADADDDPPELLRHGVLPRARKRELFVGALEEVVFPGLERFGIDLTAARAWLRDAPGPPAPQARTPRSA